MDTRKYNFLKLVWLSTVAFIAMTMSFTSVAKLQGTPLRPEKAFMLHLDMIGGNALRVNWDIAPDYFLYTNRMSITSDDVTLAVQMPDSTGLKESPDGEIEPIYAGKIVIPVGLTSSVLPKNVNIVIAYQGCAKDGFCYPPMKQLASVNLVTHAVSFQDMQQREQQNYSLRSLLVDHNLIKHIFSTEHFAFTLFIFLMLGVLLAFTPCVLPMLPILTGIIMGERKLVSTRRAFLLSFVYVLGVAVAYALAGIVASLMGNSIQVWMQKPAIIAALAAFLIVLALSLFEFFDLPVSRRWQNIAMRWSARHQGGTYLGVFLMGIFSTLIVSPCVTAPMIGVLLYIAQTGNLVFGASALFVMGLGMGIPLIIVGMSAGKFLPKSGPWMRVIVKLFGLLLLGMAVWLLTRLMTPAMTVFIWGLYLIGVAAFMYVIMPDLIRHRQFNRSVGLIAGLMGVLLMLNAIGQIPYLNKWTGLTANASIDENTFIVVRNEEQLQLQIKRAASQAAPVLVDFYADWCEACISMERKVFALDRIQKLLKEFVLIRVDLTENTGADQALMKKYNVIAPPTILLFTNHGEEVTSRRIVGELDADEFSKRINAFLAERCDKGTQC